MSTDLLSDERAVPRPAVVDRTALRVNQACLIACLALGFVFDWTWLVAAVAAVLALGTAYPPAALFQRLYRDVLRPAGLLRPDPVAEDAAPHRFAQGMGAAVLALAALALAAGATVAGWALVAAVAVLAAVNLIFGFCAGCFIFAQLQRAGSAR